jgi:hypothetical protein
MSYMDAEIDYPQDRNWIKNPPTGSLGPAPVDYKNDKHQAVGPTLYTNTPYRWANGEPAYVRPPVEEDVPNDGSRLSRLYRYKLAKEILEARGLTEFVEAIEYLNPFNKIAPLEDRIATKVVDSLNAREEAIVQARIKKIKEEDCKYWAARETKSLPRESSASFIDRFVAAVKGL